MNRKFEILTDALYRSMRFDGDMQEYFDAFMEGLVPTLYGDRSQVESI